jgi:Fanconi anemia group D2 protein
MAHIITEEDTDERLQTWMRENMVLDFTEYFVVSEGDADIFIQQAENNQYLKLEPEKHMNLDGEECQIIVKMYNLIYKVEMKDKKNLLVPMCSIFNLMQSSEKSLNDGSLQDIDALFGCGILLFKAEDLEEISLDETEYACDMLFYTINW